MFPINDDVCIHKLTVHFENGETLETVVEEREKVKILFEQAVKEGKTAVKGAFSNKNLGDLFTLRLCGFPPRQRAEVKLEVLEKLKLEDLSYCFRFPIRYIPRYTSQNQIFNENSKS
jgi:hypothetical protein